MRDELITLEKMKTEYFSHLALCQNEAGDWLKEIREARNWLQTDLAERLGYTATYICHIETGRMLASVDMLVKLSKLLGEEDESCELDAT